MLKNSNRISSRLLIKSNFSPQRCCYLFTSTDSCQWIKHKNNEITILKVHLRLINNFNAILSISRNILEKNGSAVDATLATMFCNGMVNMHSMGLGGGFLMTIYIKELKTAITLNSREAAPLKATPDMFKSDPVKSYKGM